MKIQLVLILIILSNLVIGQNRHLSIGFSNNGLCFGNSKQYNGIRFNLIDKKVEEINGMNIAIFSNSNVLNGISLGIVGLHDSLCNGLSIGVLGVGSGLMNGVAIGGAVGAEKFNGLGIGGLAVTGDTLNGLFICPFGATFWSTDKIKKISGVTIGIIFGAVATRLDGLSIGMLQNYIDTANGVMIAAFNKSEELHGFQFGILNYARNNKKIFRWMPIMNFNFKKKANK